MNRALFIFSAALACLLCSCGHNVTQYGKGLGFAIGSNREAFMVSVTHRYGEMVSAAVRSSAAIEKAEQALTTSVRISAYTVDPGKAKQVSKWKRKKRLR